MQCRGFHLSRCGTRSVQISTISSPSRRIHVASTCHRFRHTISSSTKISVAISQRRYESTPSITQTTTTTATPSSTTPSSSSISAASTTEPLTWNAFLRLRRRRRVINTISSAILAVGSLTASMSFLVEQNPEQWGFAGIDPIFVMGAVCVGTFPIGWLMGPAIGGVIWRMGKVRPRLPEFQAKEKDFFERIKRFRVDPAFSSVQNPVPDYYGEKITSVRGYRNWLKDQKAFNKKRQSML